MLKKCEQKRDKISARSQSRTLLTEADGDSRSPIQFSLLQRRKWSITERNLKMASHRIQLDCSLAETKNSFVVEKCLWFVE